MVQEEPARYPLDLVAAIPVPLPLHPALPPLPCRPWEHTYSPIPTLLILDQGVSNVAHLYYPQTPKTFPVL